MTIPCAYCGKPMESDRNENEYIAMESSSEVYCDECSYYNPDGE